MRSLWWGAAAALLIGLAACGGQGSGGPEVHITGTVRHVELEGEKDGLEVEAEARRRDDMMGIHQVGPIGQLVRVRAR